MSPTDTPRSRPLDHLGSSRLWPWLLLALGCLLVLSLLGLGRLHSQFGVQAMHSAQVYKEQIDRLDRLLALQLDAETSVRGYLLSGAKAVYLEPYDNSQRALDPLLAAMDQDFPPGHPDRAEFDTLMQRIAAKRALLADTLHGRRAMDPGPPGQGGPGMQLMDGIRDGIADLRARLETRNRQLVDESIARFNDIRHTVTLLALGALGLIVALFAVQQRQARLRARIADLLEHENVVLESTVARRTRELSDLASYLTDTREAEKAHLARELHDELGALLTAARLDAGWLLRSLGSDVGPDIRARFQRLIDTIGSGIMLKRRIIDDLRPPLLQGLGLVEALRALADDLRGEFELALQLPDHDLSCPEEQSLALFRIAQEAITNIRKYADARRLELGLTLDGPDIRLWIADDGCGFDPASPQLHRHGLAGMQHRVQMFRGEFTLDSAPGRGTWVAVRMPLRVADGGR